MGANVKLPPTDVPEHRLFHLLQQKRRALVTWFEVAAPAVVDTVLASVMRVVLRNDTFAYSGWVCPVRGTGRYAAERADIKIDLQSAEVLWRNDELKPLPDSMTQFGDFGTIFGRQALHCGIRMRQDARLWVHVVGTPYDLLEWTEPSQYDQGVGVPTTPPAPAEPQAAVAADAATDTD